MKVRAGRALIASTLTLSAAAMTQVSVAGEQWTPANAPITYKMANPADMLGQSRLPTPQYSTPQYNAPLRHSTAPARQAPTPPRAANRNAGAPVFDQNAIDPTLYSHQRIGRTYTVAGKSYTPKHNPRYDMVGTASWYGAKFHGKQTASGEIYNKNAMTAAHKTLPLNSLVVVTNMKTGTVLTLRVNDRGPFVGSRIIDLSEAAARLMGMRKKGLAEVRVQYAGPADPSAMSHPVPRQKPRTQAMRPLVPLAAPQPIPTPAPTAIPQPAAPAPVYGNNYQPLRSLGAPAPATAPNPVNLPQPQMQPQQPQQQVSIPNVMDPVSILPQATLPQMPYAAPQAYIPPSSPGGDESLVTMTIKGPIHMAGHQSAQPQYYIVTRPHHVLPDVLPAPVK